MRPAPHQPGAHILQARQFDLQLAFMRTRTLRKNFENQKGTVVHRQTQLLFEITLLSRRQALIEQHFAGVMQIGQRLDLIGLAGADKQRSVRRLAFAGNTGDGVEAAGLRQQAEFFEFAVKVRQTEVDADKHNSAFTAQNRIGQKREVQKRK